MNSFADSSIALPSPLSERSRNLRRELDVLRNIDSLQSAALPLPVVLDTKISDLIQVLETSQDTFLEKTASNAKTNRYEGWLSELAERTLIPNFEVSKEVSAKFVRQYNGTDPLRFIGRLLARSHIDSESAREIIGNVVEDALIATAAYFLSPDDRHVVIYENRIPILRNAIVKRIPRVATEQAESIADEVLCELRDSLGTSGALSIDGGAAWELDGELLVTLLPDRPLSPEELSELEQ